MDLFEHPRYQDKPVLLFFEMFVLDVIGELEYKQRKILDDLNLKKVFGAETSHWRDVLLEVLHLSSTIQIAILDEWYKKIDALERENQIADAREFAKDFADAYFDDHSTIDVWPDEESLEAAKVRIKKSQKALEKDKFL